MVKKNSIFLTVTFGLLLLFSIENGQSKKDPKQKTTRLLPTPQNIKTKKDISLKPEKIKTIYLYANAGKEDLFAAHLLQGKIDSMFERTIPVQRVHSYKHLSEPAVVLGIPSEDQQYSDYYSELDLPAPQKNTKQSYVLDTDKDLITISGGGKAGLFYGIQTLSQLLEDAKWSKKPLHGKLIQDWPDIKWRAVHFDEKLHLDRYAYLKKAIARLARDKVNAVVFEFEDKFKYRSHPIISAPHSLSPEQIKSLTQYAHKYHIDIIPLVQGLGHAGYILKHPKFKELQAYPHDNYAFNPLKEGTYDILFDFYHETMKATPGVKYFHVGGDEVQFTGENTKLQAYEKEHGTLSLYLRWLNKVNNYVTKQDRTMMFWAYAAINHTVGWPFAQSQTISKQTADSIWSHQKDSLANIVKKDFPKNAIYMQWMYGPTTKGITHIIDLYKELGLTQVAATATQNGRPLIPNYDSKPANIKSFISFAARRNLFGEMCSAWDDAGLHFETFWMGFMASAEYGWHGKNHPISLKQYWDKYIYRAFGPNTTGLYKAFHNLSKRVDFYNAALMKKGTRYSFFRKDSPVISLPSLQDVPPEGSWTAHFQSLMKEAKKEKKKNNQALKTLKKNGGKVKQNAYNLKVFASMGRFMQSHADLVLSIGKIARYADKARAANKANRKKVVITNLNKMATMADSAWNVYRSKYKHLKKVWQISRYPNGGKGFVPNRNNHFAAQREDLSYLITVEEKLNLPGYAKKLRRMIDQYKNKGSFD